MKRNIYMVIACILVLGMILAGCGADTSAGTEAQNTASAASEAASGQAASAAETSDTAAAAAQSSETIAIDTDFGTLYYPDQWQEFIRTEQALSEDVLTVSFSAEIQDTTYSLFTVTVGGTEGTKVGDLTAADGTSRPVYMAVEELEMGSSLTDGEKDRLYAMQEDLNYLIDHLK